MSMTALGPEQIAQRLYRSDNIHQAAAGPDELTDAHQEQYRRDGFLAVDHVFSPDEVREAMEGLLFLIGGGRPDFQGIEIEQAGRGLDLTPEQREPYVRKLMNFVEYEPRLRAIGEHPRMLSLLERLIGSKVRRIQDMALLKPPHVGREKPWHQDAAYLAYDPLDGVIGAWVALDPATPENGCMHVIPGSHLEGPRPHYHDRDCQMPDEDVEVERDLVVPLRPGGVLFFSGLLHHGTPPNQSARRRRAMQFHYVSVRCRKMDGPQQESHFHDERGYAACTGHPTGQRARPIADKA